MCLGASNLPASYYNKNKEPEVFKIFKLYGQNQSFAKDIVYQVCANNNYSSPFYYFLYILFF